MRNFEFDRVKYGPRVLADVIRYEETIGPFGPNPFKISYLLVFVAESGRAIVEIDDITVEAQGQSLVFAGSGSTIRIRPSRPLKGPVLLVDPEFVSECVLDRHSISGLSFSDPPATGSTPLDAEAYAMIRADLLQIERELRLLRPDTPQAVHSRTYAALVAIDRAVRSDPGVATRGRVQLRLVQRFGALVGKSFAKTRTVEGYCRELGVSRKTLALACAKHLDATPHEVIRRRVLLEARRLLVFTDLGIGQIAAKLGFSDVGHFARVFRKAEGRSPKTFRVDR